jgi:bleomycin hydrolase
MFIENPFKKFLLVALVSSMFLGTTFASNNNKLSDELIESIRSDFRMDTKTRAMYNAISNTDIKTLTLNRELLRNHNDFFTNKVNIKTITNQRSSGRCWLFAALNSLRPDTIKKKNLKDIEFSHIYLSFWDKMEKANTFYELIIRFRQRNMMDRQLVFVLKNPITDGGYWENASDLIEKYGVVPSEVMPETNSSNSTSIMNKILARKLRVDAAKLRKMAGNGKTVGELRKVKEKMLGQVYRILVMNMGQPPVKFDWRYEPKPKKDDAKKDDAKKDDAKKDDAKEEAKDKAKDDGTHKDKSVVIENYTPKQFYDEFVGLDLSEYVTLANAAPHKLLKHYQVSMTKSLSNGHNLGFANVSISTLKSIAIKSLEDSCTMWFSADVGFDQDSKKGIMASGLYDYETLFGINLKMTRAELALYRQAVPNHAMNLAGVDIKDGKPVKWLVENSWGTARGNKGFWTMYDDWFESNVFSIIVKKKYVPKKILKILEQDPTILPVWDPMW